jgi:hypothetical protein
MSSSIGSISDFVRTQLERANQDEQTGAQIGNNLTNLEDGLLELYAKGEWGASETAETRYKYLEARGLTDLIDTKTEGKSLLERIPSMEGVRKAVELKYQRASRAYEGFMTLLKNTNEIIMRAIQNIRVN